MSDAFLPVLPSPNRRLNPAARRVSSAPDLRGPPSLDTTISSSDESQSSSSSGSRSSYPHQGGTNGFRDHIAPLPAVHAGNHRRPARSTTEPIPRPATPQQQQPDLESAARTLEEVHQMIRDLQRRDRRGGFRGFWRSLRGFFGYGPDGSATRKDQVSLVGKMLFGAGQIGAIIAMLVIGARDRSPVHSTINEWQACHRPLGIWCAIWCVRVILGCLMALWGYRRTQALRPGAPTDLDEQSVNEAASQDRSSARPTNNQRHSHLHPAEVEVNRRISNVTFVRLTTLLSLLSLTWFVTAHILIYTSVHSCRISAPHLWWLTFGIICIGYLVIVEVVVVAFIVFILGPLIFLILNLILICMGRHPIRHGGNINPEVGKLSQKAVDRIPLVLYIPAPVAKTQNDAEHDASEVPLPAIPETAHTHSYPPSSEQPPASPTTLPAPRPRRRFVFRRIRFRKAPSQSHAQEHNKEKGKERQHTETGHQYEDKWERGEYPFVKLEGNRAACAICLCDFEEPKRVRYSVDSRPPENGPEDLNQAEKGLVGENKPQEVPKGELRLEDAGEGPQPLRLLKCAHVFHKSCLDPWLTEVSGRCPVCQRPVEDDDGPRSVERSRQRTRR